MAFVDDIAKVTEQVRKRSEAVTGEEATKMGLIVPFLVPLATMSLILQRSFLNTSLTLQLRSQDRWRK